MTIAGKPKPKKPTLQPPKKPTGKARPAKQEKPTGVPRGKVSTKPPPVGDPAPPLIPTRDISGAGAPIIDMSERSPLFGSGRLFGTGRVVSRKTATFRQAGIYGAPPREILLT